jgi:hypothetical protein
LKNLSSQPALDKSKLQTSNPWKICTSKCRITRNC